MGRVLSAGLRGVACAALLGAAACAHGRGPLDTASAVTRAVYANDYDGTVSRFDEAIKSGVTRTQVGDLSDRMHALGALGTISPRSADATAGKYEFDAAFSKGTMLVEMRLDPDGNVAAYRIAREPAPAR